MAWRRPWRTHVVSLYWRTRHLLLRFLCLHKVAILPFCCDFSGPNITYRTRILCLHFGDCIQQELCSPLGEVSMEYRCCQPPCARFIASDDPHSKCVKCLGFSHAREAVYGISKCTFCENLRLRTLRSRLEVFEKESSIFPQSRPGGLRGLSWVLQPGVRMLSSRLWRVSRQASPFLSLPLPSTCTWLSLS